ILAIGCRRRSDLPPPLAHGAAGTPDSGPAHGVALNPQAGVQNGSTGDASGYFYQVLASKNQKFNQAYKPLFDNPDYLGAKLARLFDQHIMWPRKMTLNFRDCGAVNAFYLKDNHTVTMCYELVDFLSSGFAKDKRTRNA